MVGKGDQVDIFALAPPLVRALRLYRRWQLSEAERNTAMRDALSDPETALRPVDQQGLRTAPESIYKMLRWARGSRWGGCPQGVGRWDTPGD